MPAKIRLQRQGRKFQSIYSIVVADSRAPRDGNFIESLGQYNPNTNPATIVLDFNRALEWLQKGAQPTDTCRAILSYKGVMYKKHLLEGVKKGAFDETEAEKRFQTWMTEKEQKIEDKRERIVTAKANLSKGRLKEEAKINESRAQEIAKRRSEMAAKEAAEEATVQDEEVTETGVTEEPQVVTEATSAKPVVEEPSPAAEAPAPASEEPAPASASGDETTSVESAPEEEK
jgi:small subunit ribosomal protein S16